MSEILAIETSSGCCSAALKLGSEILQREQETSREHSQLILGMVDSLLQESGKSLQALDAIAFGKGPGSFTGVRIAASVTQGLAFGADLPVVPVSSLAAMAQGVMRRTGKSRIVVAQDARMQQVYFAAFDGGRLMAPEVVIDPADLVIPDSGADWVASGSGWQAYQSELPSELSGYIDEYDAQLFPLARDVAELAQLALQQQGGVDAEMALPEYIRNQVVQKPKPR